MQFSDVVPGPSSSLLSCSEGPFIRSTRQQSCEPLDTANVATIAVQNSRYASWGQLEWELSFPSIFYVCTFWLKVLAHPECWYGVHVGRIRQYGIAEVRGRPYLGLAVAASVREQSALILSLRRSKTSKELLSQLSWGLFWETLSRVTQSAYLSAGLTVACGPREYGVLSSGACEPNTIAFVRLSAGCQR